MGDDTNRDGSPKRKFIDTALVLFSERGFHGVSLADVATELGLTKQSVLYHFRTKETLYGAVLADMAGRFEAIVENARAGGGSGEDRLRAYLAALFDHMERHPRDARLIARELIDNLDRARSARAWYLRPFLEESIALLADLPGWSRRSLDARTAAVAQWVGAINYFAIAQDTFCAIFGPDRHDGARAAFIETLVVQATSVQASTNDASKGRKP